MAFYQNGLWLRNLRLRYMSLKIRLRNLQLRLMLPKIRLRILLLRFVLAKNRLRDLRLRFELFFLGPSSAKSNVHARSNESDKPFYLRHQKHDTLEKICHHTLIEVFNHNCESRYKLLPISFI